MLRRLARIPGNLFVLVMVLLAVLPFLYMVSTSVQSGATRLVLWPDWSAFDLSAYTRLFTTYGFGRALGISVVVVTLACAANLVVCSLAAYAFAKRPFRGSEVLYWVYVATMMVPTQVTLIPLYRLMRDLGLLNTTVALFLPAVNAFGVFLIRQFLDAVPDDIIEAARIDGAGDLRIFWQIVLPLIRPVVVTLTVFTFISTWNDFLWPLVVTSDSAMNTVTLAAAQLQGRFTTDYGLVMAGATVAFLIPFLMYVLLQRHFVQGIASSGLK
ncbi:MAG TPA: carbohydrate ABC transporter permease [Cellulomonas sp.]